MRELPTLTLRSLHLAHPPRDFLCGLCLLPRESAIASRCWADAGASKVIMTSGKGSNHAEWVGSPLSKRLCRA
jgi:hypothetical protein